MKRIIPVIFFCVAIYFVNFSGYFEEEWNDRCCLFYNSEINGVIDYYSTGAAGNVLRLENSKIKYNFITTNGDSSPSYIEIASIGDSVSKDKFGEYLRIVKRDTGEKFVLPLNNCCK